MTWIKELPPYIARQAVQDYFPGVISEHTLACLSSKGKGPPFERWGKKIVYKTEDLIKWLEERGVKPKNG